MKTTGFDVREERRYDRKGDKDAFLGFVASHRMRLEIPMEREFLDRAIGHVAESAGEASLRISFDISDKEGLRRRAMASAVADERGSAEVLAEAAGVSLAEISRIDFSFVEVRRRSGFEYEAMYSMAESSASPDVEPEEVDAEQSVTIEWRIS